jgi:hypothetical protein
MRKKGKYGRISEEKWMEKLTWLIQAIALSSGSGPHNRHLVPIHSSLSGRRMKWQGNGV